MSIVLDETVAAEKYAVALLRAASDVTNNVASYGSYGAAIFNDVAPDDAPLQHIVYQQYAGSDFLSNQRAVVGTRLQYVFKAVGELSDKATVSRIALAIQTALQGAYGSESGYLFTITRLRPISSAPSIGSKRYAIIGGVYEIIVRPVPET